MLDLRFVRENPEKVVEALQKRNYDISVFDDFLKNEKSRKGMREAVDNHRMKLNEISEKIGVMRRQGEDVSQLLQDAKSLSETIKNQETYLSEYEEKIRNSLLVIPNIPHESVPVGKDETENVVVRTWGEPKALDFPALNHWDIAEILGIIDFDRAAKIAGARFALMKGAGARLERALMNFMLDLNTSKGYTEVFPPILVNRESMTGTGQLPKFEMELFRVADPEFYL
ncbi:MAG: serine--tRNA ligase, partial [Nitrospirae bacterium]|nr:serine--tRNA ligase [Nitrospirota bacterium]